MSSYYSAIFAGVYVAIIVIVLGLQVGLSFIGASMASSFGGFWCLGFFSSFLIGIIVAAIVPDLNLYVRKDELYAYTAMPPVPPPATRPCPACGKPVAVDGLFCSACGSKMP